jgi:hypothetical protein
MNGKKEEVGEQRQHQQKRMKRTKQKVHTKTAKGKRTRRGPPRPDFFITANKLQEEENTRERK